MQLKLSVFLSVIGFFIAPQLAYASQPAYCISNYGEPVYALDAETLPTGVSLIHVSSSPGDTNYLIRNIGNTPLVVQAKDLQRKFVNGRAYYNAYGEWREENEAYTIHGDLSSLQDILEKFQRKTYESFFASTTKPKPTPVKFSISATYGEKPIVITGELSFIVHDKYCFNTGGQPTPPRKTFLGILFDFLASLFRR